MELQTERLKIVPCTYDLLSTISTEEYEIGPHITSHLEDLKEDPTLLGWGVWLVFTKEENAIIGDIGFKGKPDLENTVEIGYGFAPSAQNNGFATEAVKELIKWTFSFDNVHKIIAECLMNNVPSIRVLEKLQMNRTESESNMLRWELKKERHEQ